MNSIEREALERIRRVGKQYPEYPHWKRGLVWGVCGGSLMFLLFAAFLFLRAGFDRYSFMASLGGFGCGFLLTGAFGAFRPGSDQTNFNGKR